MAFTFTPQNFVDNVGPVASAAWLNGIDLTVNNALQGLTTTAAIAALLGVQSISLPLAINQGGLNATTVAGGLENLGFAGPTAAEANAGFTTANMNLAYPVGHVYRYLLVGDGTTDNAALLTAANGIGIPLFFPPGGIFKTALNVTVTVPLWIVGMLRPASGTSITFNGIALTMDCSKHFDYSLGGTVLGVITNTEIYPQWWGATGSGVSGVEGVANSTTTFTDTNAGFTASNVGDSIVVQAPPYSANASFIGTISAVASATSITLSGNPGWSATGLTYYYGENDFAAINSANAFVGQMKGFVEYSAGYNNFGLVAELTFPPAVYIYSGGSSVGISQSASTADRWRGRGGRATVALGITSGTVDCIQFGGGSAKSALIEDMIFDCNFTGQDGLTMLGFQSPTLRNVDVLNSQRDMWAFKPTSAAGTWIQQGHFESVYFQNCGRHFININPTGTGSTGVFVNEIDIVNLTCGGVSVRTSGGSFINTTSPNTAYATFDSWHIKNWKCTLGWSSIIGSAYQPSASPIVIGTDPNNANVFERIGLRFENGYFESPGGTLGANSPLVQAGVYTSGPSGGLVTSKVSFRNCWTLGWGFLNATTACDGQGVISGIAATSGTATVLATGAYYSANLLLTVQVTSTSGANPGAAKGVFLVSGIGSEAPQVTQIGTTVAQSNAPPLNNTVLAGSLSGGNQGEVIYSNTGSTTAMLTYSSIELDTDGSGLYYRST